MLFKSPHVIGDYAPLQCACLGVRYDRNLTLFGRHPLGVHMNILGAKPPEMDRRRTAGNAWKTPIAGKPFARIRNRGLRQLLRHILVIADGDRITYGGIYLFPLGMVNNVNTCTTGPQRMRKKMNAGLSRGPENKMLQLIERKHDVLLSTRNMYVRMTVC